MCRERCPWISSIKTSFSCPIRWNCLGVTQALHQIKRQIADDRKAMQDRSKRVTAEKQQQVVGRKKEDEGGGKKGGRGEGTEGEESKERGGERKSYDVCRVQVGVSYIIVY